MTRTTLLLLSILFLLPANAAIKKLQVEYITNPIGLDVKTPRFSWQLHSEERGVKQTAYQITVATDTAFSNTIWNSGKVDSDESLHIYYTGPALTPSTRYYWKVTAWNNKTGEETSTEKAFFETGLLDSGWSGAQWIKATQINKNSDINPEDKQQTKARMLLDMDVTVTSDNASVLFGARDASNLFMWSIITVDNPNEPLIRRHIYDGGRLQYTDTPIGKYFSKSDLLNKERHLTIEVKDGVVKTYIDKVLVDTYTDTDNKLSNGAVGFRAFKGENSNEIAVYDNVVLTEYEIKGDKEIAKVVLKENFENSKSVFDGGEIVMVDGNRKLKMATQSGDYRILQASASGVPMFRKDFKANKKIASARIYSSALGVYDLFINGKRVGHKMEDGSMLYDELKPEWTDFSKTAHYLTYDITPLLKRGTNTVGAHVSSGWWNGDVTHGEYGAREVGFIAKIVLNYTDGTSEAVVTDLTWLSSTDGPIRMGDIYHGETYDARKESAWTQPGYNTSKWNKTAVNPYFKGKLIGFAGPTVQVRPQLKRIPISITTYRGEKNGKINTLNVTDGPAPIQLKKGETAIYNLGQNMVGWVRFNVKGASGTVMKIRFAEILNDTGDKSRGDDGPAGSVYTANLRSAKATLRYTLKGSNEGEAFHPSMTFFGFQYCEIIADEDIEVLSLTGEVVGSATEEGSSFATSSSLINQLYSNVMWGQRGNYLSIPTDCPQRDERLGWTGDTQVFCRAASYNANVSSFFEKWMKDMRDGQRDDGAFPDVAPHSWVGYGGAAWADAGIIVPWTIYLMYDNKGILQDNYASMEKYMEFLSRQQGDGYNYNGGETYYGDWLSYEDTERRYVSVCYYAYTAQLMAKISEALKAAPCDAYDMKAKAYRDLAQEIKKEFQTRYVEPDGDLKQKSQTAYLLALKLDLFPTEEAKEKGVKTLISKIAKNGNRLSTGFVGTAILNQTLSQFGETGTAYNLLLQRENPSWLYSVDQGATTIWERWDSYTIEKGFNSVSMNSFNHYSYGAVSEWMYSTMGGIDVDETQPGFKHIVLHPVPDNRTQLPAGQERITWVDASFHSGYGDIKSAWKKENDGSVVYKVAIPANTTATLHLQLPTLDYVVEENGRPAAKAEGVSSITFTKEKAVLKLQSGTYQFTVKNGK